MTDSLLIKLVVVILHGVYLLIRAATVQVLLAPLRRNYHFLLLACDKRTRDRNLLPDT